MAEMWYVATPNITKSGFYKAQHDRKPPLYRAEATRNTYGVARSAPYPPPPPVNPAAVILGWQARLPANQARHTGSESSLHPPQQPRPTLPAWAPRQLLHCKPEHLPRLWRAVQRAYWEG